MSSLLRRHLPTALSAAVALALRSRLYPQHSVARVATGYLLALSALFIVTQPERLGPLENPLHFTEKVQNYRVERERLAEQGHAPSALFPPIPYSYRETDPTRSLMQPGGTHWLGTDTEGVPDELT